ncbi:putative transporter (transmembrane protein) [Comamonas sp. BIGb0124]|uniref:mechanosensitive ion channel n=1 Tax=Comamonas sp. BIGb0124 TaxID=2485130 RepID=UPI000F488583|nr:mechanosensitive ion channel [Comamonas sp. BIGb0124]ROR24960.1 putative transporter (transmembrane protein) [Comamonas sp. BIGb0124]
MNVHVFYEALQNALGHNLLQILGGLLVLVVGWLLAVLARAGVHRLLSLLRVNSRVSESAASPVDLESPIASGVFWLVLLVTLVAVLNALNLSYVSAPFADLLAGITGYLPNLLAGMVLIVVTWLVATFLRALVKRLLAATTLDERLSAEAGMRPMSQTAGDVLFWLVILFFLPAILSAFSLYGVLEPVRGMLSKVLDMVPNVFAAAVVGLVGWLVARVLRGLVTNLLSAAGADTINERVGLDPAIKLSRLLGTIVFILVFVPSLIAALDALRIEAISEPAANMLAQILDAVPAIVAAAVILLLTWYVAKFAGELVARLLESAGFDSLPAKLGVAHALSGNTSPSRLASFLVKFFAMLFASVEAASQLGFYQVSDVVATFISFGGDVLLGGAILVVGFWLSGVTYRAIVKASPDRSTLIANVARFAIIGLVVAMGLRAMGIANEIVQLAFGLTLGAVTVAVALAFGLGGREAAGRLANRWVSRLERNADEAHAMDAGSHAASTTTAVVPSVEAGTAIPLPPSDDGSPR